MAALTLTPEVYRDKVLGAWQGKSAGVTLGSALRGQRVPGRFNYYSPVPGQPAPSIALDFSLIWLSTMEETGAEITAEDLAVAWLEHIDVTSDEFGYAVLNLQRGVPPPASGAHSNWFRNATGGMMRADFWALLAPGAPQVAAAYAYQDASLDHCEEGVWAAMFLAALASAAFFLTDTLTLATIGLAMIPRTCRTARAVKTALAAAQRGASWLEARENVQHEVGHGNFSDAPQNMGFFTIGLLYGPGGFGPSVCAGVNCAYDSEAVGGALGAVLGIRFGASHLPEEWIRPLGDLLIPGSGMRNFMAPRTLTEVSERTALLGERVVAARCPDIAIEEIATPPVMLPDLTESLPHLKSDPATAPETESPATHGDAPGAISHVAEGEPAHTIGMDSTAIDTTESAVGLPGEPTDAAGHEALPPAAPDAIEPGNESPLSAEPSFPSDAPRASSLEMETIPSSSMDAPPSGGQITPVFAPQPVSQEEGPVEGEQASSRVSSTGTDEAASMAAAPMVDPVNAIAWVDSTLVKPLLVTPKNALAGRAGSFEVVLDTGDAPTIGYNQAKTLVLSVTNRGATPFTGRISLLSPSGWQVTPPAQFGQRQFLAAHQGVLRAEFTVKAPDGQARIDIANSLLVRLTPEDGTPTQEAPFVLLGASCWWIVGAFTNYDGEGFDRAYAPEERPGLQESYLGRSQQMVRWERRLFSEAAIDIEPFFRGSSGVCYGQTVLRCPEGRVSRLVANTNSGVKVWLNGQLVLRRFNRETFRPQIGEGHWSADVTLKAGDNPVMIKWVRGAEPFEFSLTVSDQEGHGMPDVGNPSW